MASVPDQSIVVGGGLAGTSVANTVLEDGGREFFVGQVHVGHPAGWSEEA